MLGFFQFLGAILALLVPAARPALAAPARPTPLAPGRGPSLEQRARRV